MASTCLSRTWPLTKMLLAPFPTTCQSGCVFTRGPRPSDATAQGGEETLGDRAINESAYPHKAPVDQGPRRPCGSNSPRLKHLERGDRGVG